MVFLTGDCHADIDYGKLKKENFAYNSHYEWDELTRDDYLIVLGDFGVIWSQKPDELEKKLIDFYNNFPATVCFVCGNHSNHYRLESEFPEIDFHGGRAHKISDNIYHLMRGYIFDFDGKKFFAFGGASSHDIKDGILDPNDPLFLEKYDRLIKNPFSQFRIRGVSWWERELPSEEEMIRGIDNLEKVDYKVDFVISHCLPSFMLTAIYGSHDYEIDKLNDYFNELYNSGLEFGKWYCGHYHIDWNFGDFVVMYDNIERVV